MALLVAVLVMLGTATKLQTARTIAISGGATGTATSFNGTGNISIPVTSLDATKLSGTASIATTGNAGSATKLKDARTINGTSFNGTGNITTSKWGTARTIGLSGAVSGSASVDGSGNVTISTTQANITVLTGSLTISASTSGSKNINYPSSYTSSNCVPISCGIYNVENKGYNFVGFNKDSASSLNNAWDRRLNLTSSNIVLVVDNPNSSEKTVNYKIVLMKIS